MRQPCSRVLGRMAQQSGRGTAVAPAACLGAPLALNPPHLPHPLASCTDAAIYMHTLGARLLPGPEALPLAAYAAACPPASTARMFLEPMPEQWLAPSRRGKRGGAPGAPGVHVFAPNFENAYASDKELHAAADLVLCKVKRCKELFAPYLKALGSEAGVMYTGGRCGPRWRWAPGVGAAAMQLLAGGTAADTRRRAGAPSPPPRPAGHTAIDPASAPAGAPASEPAAPAAATAAAAAPPLPASPDYGSFLHVRGKSELKHTAQLLDCWSRHPEWPTLTVLGCVALSGASRGTVMPAGAEEKPPAQPSLARPARTALPPGRCPTPRSTFF
jgi:hypothetical protein